MHFNINDNVQVRLTAHGRAVHAADHATFWASVGKPMPYTAPKEDGEGWSTWQMHSLMTYFGPHIGLGFTLCFDTTIRILEISAH